MKERKDIRIPDADYCSGAWFVTICAQGRLHRFGEILTVGDGSPVPYSALNQTGSMVEAHIRMISEKYPSVTVTDFIIMPDHIHVILLLEPQKCGRGNPAPTLGNIIGWFKYQTAKAFNAGRSDREKLWQRNYYEHAIRNDRDHRECAEYIQNNPLAWADKREFSGGF